jgi:hypothetical protein
MIQELPKTLRGSLLNFLQPLPGNGLRLDNRSLQGLDLHLDTRECVQDF